MSATLTDDGPVIRVAVPLPLATAAEQAIAGCAVATADGGEVALDHGLEESHFYDVGAWRAIVASLDAPRWDGSVCGCPDLRCVHALGERRIAYVAERAQVEPAELRQWCDARPVMVDSGGGLARRVIAAAVARRRLAEALELVAAA